ncbi:MAG TPA: VOC family protein [Acetobacteraceae bacterium]|nr:VOC family protein [Acetobacteraceae bacterium]
MPNGPFGLEHPIVATDNLDALAERYRRLGFAPTKRAFHPWGTANHLVVFAGSFIELLGIADADLLDDPGETGFRFGRFIARTLDRTDGVAMVALRSNDIAADTQALAARGLEPDALVNFRRAATLPDGTEDEAAFSLAMLMDEERPRLSYFLCQHHRPEFVFVPKWMDHPNGALAITRITYAVGEPFAVWSRFKQIWGEPALTDVDGGFSVETAGGQILVLDRMTIENRYFQTPLPQGWREEACAVAITIRVRSLHALHVHMLTANVPFLLKDDAMLIAPREAGTVILEFVE